MKKEAKTIVIEETDLDIQEGKNMLINLLNNQINNYKLKYLNDWEKNHNISPVDKDQKINQLEKLKNELRDFLAEYNFDDKKLNFTISFDLKFTETVLKRK